MAFDDTLFQLGMDLARGTSPAQKEEALHSAAACAERTDHFVARDGTRFAGTHLIIDLYGARRLDELEHIERTLKRCIETAGARLIDLHLHRFGAGGGVSGVAVLAESHISIHSWPEADYAALDVFMCGEARPELTIGVLQQAFDARQIMVSEHRRGKELEGAQWHAGSKRPCTTPGAPA